MADEPVSIKEIAAALGISESTVSRRLKDTGIKPVNENPNLKKQKKALYPADTIDRLRLHPANQPADD